MKKVLYFLAATLVAVAACNKPEVTPTPTPEPEPEPTPTVPDLTLSTPKIVDVEAESSIYTVKFDAGKDWTAVLSYPDGSNDGAVLENSSGKAAEAVELRVTFQGLDPEVQRGRLVQLDIKAGAATESIQFFQGLVFLADNKVDMPVIGVAGEKYDLHIQTNMDVSIKKYDGADEAFPWAPVTITKGDHSIDLSFNVAANEGYDARTAYVKFTMPQIQVPVLDDEGVPTGETTDYVQRFYLNQEGHTVEEWKSFLTEDFYVGESATATVAMFSGKLLVSDSKNVYKVDPQTGKFEGVLNTEGLPVQSITSDDAGNLLLANLGGYGELFDVYAVKADDSELANPVHLIHFVNEAWSGSTGIDKVSARGDVFGNGVVTAIYGGVGSYGGLTYTLYWGIEGGKAAESYYNEWNPVVNPASSGWLSTPELGDDLWLSNRAAFVPAGASIEDGFFYGGYDGLYNVLYYNNAEWQVSVEGAGDWAGGPQGLHAVDWNGRKILVIAQMGYVWWADGWGMPAYLWVVDVTDPVNPEVLSRAEYNSNMEQIISGDTENSTVDVLPVVDGDDLVVYYVDTAQGHLVKVRFPKL